jgi:hypothetical protein
MHSLKLFPSLSPDQSCICEANDRVVENYLRFGMH